MVSEEWVYLLSGNYSMDELGLDMYCLKEVKC